MYEILEAPSGRLAASPTCAAGHGELMTQLGRARAAWKDEALSEFIRLRCNVQASRDVAGRLLRAASELKEASCGWGVPADALQHPLDDLLRLALYARAGRDVMPELIGATLVFVFEALERAEAGAGPEHLAWLRKTAEAFVAAIAHVSRRHAPISFEDYRSAKAGAEAVAGKGQSTFRVDPTSIAACQATPVDFLERRYAWCGPDLVRNALAS